MPEPCFQFLRKRRRKRPRSRHRPRIPQLQERTTNDLIQAHAPRGVQKLKMQGLDLRQFSQHLAEKANLVPQPLDKAMATTVVLHHSCVAIDMMDSNVQALKQTDVACRQLFGEGHGALGHETAGEKPLVGEGGAVVDGVDDEGVVGVD